MYTIPDPVINCLHTLHVRTIESSKMDLHLIWLDQYIEAPSTTRNNICISEHRPSIIPFECHRNTITYKN